MVTLKQGHLVVICHGLWGSEVHIQQIGQYVKAAFDDQSDNDQHLEILYPLSNSLTKTYDGIDFCAIRVCQEIDDKIASLQSEGVDITRFSIIGYSLGGLIARYALGILASRTPSFFTEITPVNFVTLASPAIGVPRYPSFGSKLINALGSRIMSRTGRQLYCKDNFHDGKPLVEIMAEPQHQFRKALDGFQKKSVYANAVKDRTVPFATGIFEPHDPFDYAWLQAERSRKQRHAEENEPMDLREGGLEVEVDPEFAPLIQSFKIVDPMIPHVDDDEKDKCKRKKRFRIRVPFLLRPSSYPFYPFPINYLMAYCFPIVAPFILSFIFSKFVYESMKSSRRISAAKIGNYKTREGRLATVGISIERMMSLQGVAMEDSADTDSGNSSEAEVELEVPIASHATHSNAEVMKALKALTTETKPTDAQLTDAQKRAMDYLNGIPELQKFLAFFPQARHSHGSIIVRDPKLESHQEGKGILKHLGANFVF